MNKYFAGHYFGTPGSGMCIGKNLSKIILETPPPPHLVLECCFNKIQRLHSLEINTFVVYIEKIVWASEIPKTRDAKGPRNFECLIMTSIHFINHENSSKMGEKIPNKKKTGVTHVTLHYSRVRSKAVRLYLHKYEAPTHSEVWPA